MTKNKMLQSLEGQQASHEKRAYYFAEKIRSRLLQEGWKLNSNVKDQPSNGVQNWGFLSIKQAYGMQIYLSFIVNPIDEYHETGGCFRVGTNIPKYCHQSEGEIAELDISSGKFVDLLKTFIGTINKHRNAVHVRTQKEEA